MSHFRRLGVTLLLTGHEHLFEHWVERHRTSAGERKRIDHIVTGGGGAPLYAYRGDPDLRPYLAAHRPDSVRVERIVGPGPKPGDNPYHYIVVHVDGAELFLEVFSVDWGVGFQPYRSNRTRLIDGGSRP